MSSNKVAQLYLLSQEANENVNNIYLVFRNIDFKILFTDCVIGDYYVLNLVNIVSQRGELGVFTFESNGMVFHNIDLINQADTEYKIKNRGTFPLFTSGSTTVSSYANYGIPMMFKLTNQICDIVIRTYLQSNDYAYTEANAINNFSLNFDIYKINNNI